MLVPPKRKGKKGGTRKAHGIGSKLADASPGQTRSQERFISGDEGALQANSKQRQERLGSGDEGKAPPSSKQSEEGVRSGRARIVPLRPKQREEGVRSGDEGAAPPSSKQGEEGVRSGDEGDAPPSSKQSEEGVRSGKARIVPPSSKQGEEGVRSGDEGDAPPSSKQREEGVRSGDEDNALQTAGGAVHGDVKKSKKKKNTRPNKMPGQRRDKREPIRPTRKFPVTPAESSSSRPMKSDSSDVVMPFNVQFSCNSKVKPFAQLAFSVFCCSNLDTIRHIFPHQPTNDNSQEMVFDIGACIDSHIIDETLFIEGSSDKQMKEICEGGEEEIVDYFVRVSIALCSMNWDTPWIKVNSSKFDLPDQIAKTMEGQNSDNVKRGRSEETWKAPDCVIFQFGSPQDIERYLHEQTVAECPGTINRRFLLPRYQLKWALGRDKAYVANDTSLYHLSRSLKLELISQERISQVCYCCYVATP